MTSSSQSEARRMMIAQAALDTTQGEVLVFEQDTKLRYTWTSQDHITRLCIGKTDGELMERADEAAAVSSIKRMVLNDGHSQSADMLVHVDGAMHRYRLSVHAMYDESQKQCGIRGLSIRLPPNAPPDHLETLTHDMRNILNPMAGLVDILDTLIPDRATDPQVQWAIHNLVDQIREANRLLEQADHRRPHPPARHCTPRPKPNVSRILLVDDDPAQTRMLRIALRRQGFEVETADSGAACMKRIDSFKPDIVFMDLGLGDIDGLELMGTIRRMHPHLTVVATTGRDGDKEAARSLQAGFDGHLTKPVGMNELLQWMAPVPRNVP